MAMNPRSREHGAGLHETSENSATLRGVKTQPKRVNEHRSTGGGRGIYSGTDGDVPSRLSMRPKPDDINDEQHIFDIQLLSKNVQSIRSRDRERELFEELGGLKWDVVCINETCVHRIDH